MTPHPMKGLSPEVRLALRGWEVSAAGCWELQGRVDTKGNPLLMIAGKYPSVRRIAYRAFVDKELSDDCNVLSSCSNRRCINPGHLFIKEPEKRPELSSNDNYVLEEADTGRFDWTSLGRALGWSREQLRDVFVRADRHDLIEMFDRKEG